METLPLKMLWHHDFRKYPISGLAEYQGEKVYFTIKNEPVKIVTYSHDVCNTLDKLKLSYNIDDYEVELAVISVRNKLSYDIYRLSPHILKQFEKLHNDFDKAVGYHTWHDPAVYKPFMDTNVPLGYSFSHIEDFNISNFTYLGTFTYDKFQYFKCPI